ncbi:FecR domain-containing protein [Candidatus Woesearchaeota archaeon]|nr:FecR domain-containing protein [Candidatus Woesearchaeota archaeon]
MNKTVIVIIVVVILVLAGGAYYVTSPGSVAKALLYTEGTDTQVDLGKGWQPATDEMELPQGAKVKTGTAEATLVLLEGELLTLLPNTEITLEQVNKNVIKISQQAGETLNKITKLSGIQGYSISTPNSVATVRGTTFFYSDEEVTVEDGEVTYGPKEEPDKVKVNGGRFAQRSKWQAQDNPADKKARFEQYRQKHINTLKRIREREMKKHKFILKMADSQGYNEAKRAEKLNQIDEDPRPSEDEAYNKAPAPLKKPADRTYRLTKEIKRVKAMKSESTPATTAPTACKNPGQCRIWDNSCGGQGVERLMKDGQGVKCVDAHKASAEGIDYCGRMPQAQNNRECNYQNAETKQSCVCPR